MRILPLSDLHREIYPNRNLGIDLEISRPDVIILAGDIAKGTSAVQWAAETFKDIPVLYVAGNHEYYGHKIDTLADKIDAACMNTDNVEFLNADTCAVIDDVQFCGATLWTDFALFGDHDRNSAMVVCQQSMNDYHQIRVQAREYARLTVMETAALHAKHRNYINRCLNSDWNQKSVVISHMAPSMKSVPLKYRDHILSAAFASNLDTVAEKADLWIHGHTHTSMDYTIGKCRVVCNPCGYQLRSNGNENPDFNPNLIIEI